MAHLESLVIFDPTDRTREALVFGFERQGLKVHATANAQDALAMAQTRVPQLFVAAVPGLDPEEENPEESETVSVVGRLREDPATRELPIVVLGERGAREPALRAGADEFVARPAFIRDVITLSTLAVAIRQDGDETGVAGMLEDYELYFLTRALSVAERSGVLALERGNRVGEVHFVKGEVVTARCGRMSGLQAFHQLLLWSEAAIHLRLSSPAGERKIHVPIDELLSAGARFAQEFEAVSDRVGGTRAVYRQEPRRAAEARAQIPAEVMVLLKCYDGRRELIDVVEDSPFKALDTIKITWRLADLGVIERVGDGAAASPLTAQLAVRDWLLGSNQEESVRSTVTEAGRRAAEAYAEHEARLASAPPPPAHDLLDDTDRVRTLAGQPEPAAPQEIAAPQQEITAPHESEREKQEPHARNKSRKRRPSQPGRKTGPRPKVEMHPSQPEGPPPVVDYDKTIPFSKMPFELQEAVQQAQQATRPPAPVPPPVPAPAPAPPAVAKAPAPPAVAKAPEEPRPQPVKHAPIAQPKASANPQAKSPSGHAPNKTGPFTRESVPFTKVEEEFFAQEAELQKVKPAESFEDLEPIERTSPKRRWFNFGGKKFAPAAPKGPSKKR